MTSSADGRSSGRFFRQLMMQAASSPGMSRKAGGIGTGSGEQMR